MGQVNRKSTGKQLLRILCYLFGLLILTMGLTLNTKTSLGVAPIVSVAYCISELTGLNFGDMTFLWFCVLVLIQVVLHLIKRGPKLKQNLITDFLQIAVSIISTRFMNVLSAGIPVFGNVYPDKFIGSFPGRFLMLILAIVLTGVGAALSLFMRIAPIPGDGVVQGIADFFKIKTGTAKNAVDFSCVMLTTVMSLLFAHRLIGIGIGTVTAMIGVGRIVALMEKLFGKQLKLLAQGN